MTKEEVASRFLEIVREIDYIENIIMTLSWDMRVNLPSNSAQYRGDSIGFLSSESLRRKTSPEMKELLDTLDDVSFSDQDILPSIVRKYKREYSRGTEVPPELLSEYASHNLQTELIWQESRKNNDYTTLKPWLEKEFEYKRLLAACHGYEKDPLSGLMDEWEPGIDRTVMDRLFEDLKSFELPMLEKLKSSSVHPDNSVYLGYYPAATQASLCHELLNIVGFDFTRGRMDVSAHPYTTVNDPNDIRFTTHYHENDFSLALLSCMHEGGHAIHWQNTDPSLRYTTMEFQPGAGISESQSRFMENIIGRSLPFWEFALPIASKYFPELKKFSPYEFYESLNCLHLTSDRLKSDELSYNLHIIMRYELEKMLFDKDISFKDLPHYWNRKSVEYLGICPENDSSGVLQDMHWSSGYIGYFHTYVLGNFYDGHYYDSMIRDIPDFDDQIRHGQFNCIVSWLKNRIQKYGSLYTPSELLYRIDGEQLSASHYINYAEKKFSSIYQI